MLKEIPEEYMKGFEPSEKVGIVATVTPEGRPHISLMCSIQANNPKQIIWGQFIEGTCKKNVKLNPKTSFFIMNLQKQYWAGKAIWTHEKKEGPEYIMYNDKPMYRYNTYFGIHTVHFLDLVEISETSKLNMAAIAAGTVMTAIAKGKAATGRRNIMNSYTKGLFDKVGNVKLISYMDKEGFPVIIPVIQACSADGTRIIFSLKPSEGELKNIPEGAEVCIFAMSLDMEAVLAEGKYKCIKAGGGIKAGVMDIERIYNPMPPKMGYIYPEKKIEAICEF